MPWTLMPIRAMSRLHDDDAQTTVAGPTVITIVSVISCVVLSYSYIWWWWLQHPRLPSKDDEACAISVVCYRYVLFFFQLWHHF